MKDHLPGCPLGESAVPASTCTPCHYIRVGIGLGREMPLIDPRHEPGLASLPAKAAHDRHSSADEADLRGDGGTE